MALYDDAVNLAKPYVGPAAGKLIDRQLKKMAVDKDSLDAGKIDELAKCCYDAGKLLMDESEAKELSEKVKALK